MMIQYNHSLSVEAYLSLRKSMGWYVMEAQQAKAGLDNSTFITVATDNGRPVGMARVVGDHGYIAIIVDVIVLPDYQHQGIGSQLMRNIIDHYNTYLDTYGSVMLNLMAAYEKEGFYEKFGFISRPNSTMGAGMVQWLGTKIKPDASI